MADVLGNKNMEQVTAFIFTKPTEWECNAQMTGPRIAIEGEIDKDALQGNLPGVKIVIVPVGEESTDAVEARLLAELNAAPTWPTPVAWSDLKEGETYYSCWRTYPLPIALTVQEVGESKSRMLTRTNGDSIPNDFINADPENRPMIYKDDENGTGKQKAAAAMQILLEEWARG